MLCFFNPNLENHPTKQTINKRWLVHFVFQLMTSNERQATGERERKKEKIVWFIKIDEKKNNSCQMIKADQNVRNALWRNWTTAAIQVFRQFVCNNFIHMKWLLLVSSIYCNYFIWIDIACCVQSMCNEIYQRIAKRKRKKTKNGAFSLHLNILKALNG